MQDANISIITSMSQILQMQRMKKIVAYLHDVVEDTSMTIEDLPLKDSVKQSSGQLMQIQKRMNLDCIDHKKVGIICTEETKNSYQGGICKSIGTRSHPETIARNLFAILREFDDEGVVQIYSECFSEDGLGEAIMNRLMKAASHQIIHL